MRFLEDKDEGFVDVSKVCHALKFHRQHSQVHVMMIYIGSNSVHGFV